MPWEVAGLGAGPQAAQLKGSCCPAFTACLCFWVIEAKRQEEHKVCFDPQLHMCLPDIVHPLCSMPGLPLNLQLQGILVTGIGPEQ